MPVPEPNLLREAAAQFQPRRRPRFNNLAPCREVIIELREKGASCQSIAELLGRHGVKTSRTMVNEYVHLLGWMKPSRQRKAIIQNRPPNLAKPPNAAIPALPEVSAHKARGPHIAKVELLKPGQTNE